MRDKKSKSKRRDKSEKRTLDVEELMVLRVIFCVEEDDAVGEDSDEDFDVKGVLDEDNKQWENVHLPFFYSMTSRYQKKKGELKATYDTVDELFSTQSTTSPEGFWTCLTQCKKTEKKPPPTRPLCASPYATSSTPWQNTSSIRPAASRNALGMGGFRGSKA